MADDLTLVARLSANASEFVDAMGKAARAAGKFATDAQKEFAGVAEKLDDIGRQAKDIGLKLGAVGAAIAAPLAIAGKDAAQFGKGMANVAALGVKDLGKLADGVQDLREEYGLLEDGTEAAYNAISAGVSESATLGVIEMAAKGARAGVSSLNEALDAGTSIMNSYGWNAGTAEEQIAAMERAMGVLNTTVLYGKTTMAELSGSVGRGAANFANAGVSVEEFGANIAALTSTGLSASESVTLLNASLTSLNNQSEESKKITNALGIEFSATAMEAKGYTDFWVGVVEAVKAGNPELYAKKVALEEELVALEASNSATEAQIETLREQKRQLSAAKQPTKELSDQIAALSASLKSGKDRLSDVKGELADLKPVSEDYNATLTKILGSSESFRGINAITGPLLDKVREAMVGMKDGVDNLNKSFENSKAADPSLAFDRLAASTKTLSETVGAAVLESFGPLADELTDIVQKTRDWVQANPELSASLVGVSGAVSGLLIALGGLGFIIGGLASGTAALMKLGPVFIAISGWLGNIWMSLQLIWGSMGFILAGIGTFAATAPAAFALVIFAIALMVTRWSEFWSGAWTIAKGALGLIWDVVSGFFDLIWTAIKSVWYLILSFFQVITGDFSGAVESWKKIGGAWYDLFAGWIDGLLTRLSDLWQTTKDVAAFVFGTLNDGEIKAERIPDQVLARAKALRAAGRNDEAKALLDQYAAPTPAPNIPALATGGIVTRPTLALVGEAGPEAIIPLDRMGSVTTDNSNVTIQVYGSDPRATAEAVFEIIQRRKLT